MGGGLLTIWSYFYYYLFPTLSVLIVKESVSLKEVCTRGNSVLCQLHVIIVDYVADRVIRDTRRFKKEIGADDNQKRLFLFVDTIGERSYLAGVRSDNHL